MSPIQGWPVHCRSRPRRLLRTRLLLAIQMLPKGVLPHYIAAMWSAARCWMFPAAMLRCSLTLIKIAAAELGGSHMPVTWVTAYMLCRILETRFFATLKMMGPSSALAVSTLTLPGTTSCAQKRRCWPPRIGWSSSKALNWISLAAGVRWTARAVCSLESSCLTKKALRSLRQRMSISRRIRAFISKDWFRMPTIRKRPRRFFRSKACRRITS